MNHICFMKILEILSKTFTKLNLPLSDKFNISFHYHIEKMLRPYFINAEKKLYNVTQNHSKINIIWIFWWQGTCNMPKIVRACINSIKYYSSKYKIILITKYNIKKYTNIPYYIFIKLNKRLITFTHFSDILRFNLLHNYGGLWIDATIYCTSNIKQIGYIYTSGGYHNYHHFFVCSKWTSFLIGGDKDNPLFTFMNNFYKLYWKYNNTVINYFLMDYALLYAYNHNIGQFKSYVNNKAYKNNPHLYSLVKLLNKPYDTKTYKFIVRDTNLFKLTYKKNFKDNNKSFYSKLIKSKGSK